MGIFSVRGLFIAAAVAMATIVAWFLLTLVLGFVRWAAGPLLLLTALFLIMLVLVQRGKGGGLAGAFGGLGGQSAFGTKAGDLFTRVTIGVALFWIILCMATISVLGTGEEGPLAEDIGGGGGTRPEAEAPASPDEKPGGGSAPAPIDGGNIPKSQDTSP